jgi:hypothetical protein
MAMSGGSFAQIRLTSTRLVVSTLILDELWGCYFAFTLFKFSEYFVVQGVMEGRDYIWKGEKKGAERGIFREHIYEFATRE